jgi:hypothetical protein
MLKTGMAESGVKPEQVQDIIAGELNTERRPRRDALAQPTFLARTVV